MDSALTTLMLESLFGIIETSPKTEARVSDQFIEAMALVLLEVEYKGRPIKEVEAGPEKVELLHT